MARLAKAGQKKRRRQRRNFTEEFKAGAVRLVLDEGKSVANVALAGDVAAWLAEDPDLPTQELLRRGKDKAYTGNKTAFYAPVAGVRPLRAAPPIHAYTPGAISL